MGRPKNTESKQRLIIQAVHQVLAREGYAGATMKNVAAAAGISHGLLHYYFESKEAMMVAVMYEEISQISAIYAKAFASLRPGDDVAALIVREYRRLLEETPDIFNVFLECWPLLMHTTDAMREVNKDLYDRFKASLLDQMEDLQKRELIRPAIPVRDLTAMLTAFFDGLGFQIQANPAMAGDDAFWRNVEDGLRAWLG